MEAIENLTILYVIHIDSQYKWHIKNETILRTAHITLNKKQKKQLPTGSRRKNEIWRNEVKHTCLCKQNGRLKCFLFILTVELMMMLIWMCIRVETECQKQTN